jgi:hypothetical protein
MDDHVAERWLERVNEQLRLYEHPLLRFEANIAADAVEVTIRLRPGLGLPQQHRYTFPLHPRDLDNPQFEWQFQRQLYDALHDYLIEMFIRTPQDRKERRRP